MDWVQGGLIVVILLQLVLIRAVLELARRLDVGLMALDSKLAGALASAIAEIGGGGFEPPNPIQQALAQLLVSRATDSPAVEVLSRATDGKFSTE